MAFEPGADWPHVKTYKPLNKSKDEIRVLTLLPGEGRIDCELSHISLQDAGHDPYVAMSYAWGKPDRTVTIKVDGEDVEMRRTVWEFLEALRAHSKGRPRRFWLDILCINQRDPVEKSSQVQMMAEIFRSADEVNAWLGGESPLLDAAFDFLDDFANIPKWESTPWYQWFGLAHSHFAQKPRELLGHYLEGLVCFFGRPFWTRVWILQEIALARSVQVMSGRRSHSLRTLSALCFYGPDHGPIIDMVFNVDSHWRAAYKINSLLPPNLNPNDSNRYKARPLTQTLRSYGESNCSDERDRVYGLLSLCEDGERRAIKVDYQKTALDVFLDAFSLVLNGQEELRMEDLETMSELWQRMRLKRDEIKSTHVTRLRSQIENTPQQRAWVFGIVDSSTTIDPVRGRVSISTSDDHNEISEHISPGLSAHAETELPTDSSIRILELTEEVNVIHKPRTHTRGQLAFVSLDAIRPGDICLARGRRFGEMDDCGLIAVRRKERRMDFVGLVRFVLLKDDFWADGQPKEEKPFKIAEDAWKSLHAGEDVLQDAAFDISPQGDWDSTMTKLESDSPRDLQVALTPNAPALLDMVARKEVSEELVVENSRIKWMRRSSRDSEDDDENI